jgi:hypothetical protein
MYRSARHGSSADSWHVLRCKNGRVNDHRIGQLYAFPESVGVWADLSCIFDLNGMNGATATREDGMSLFKFEVHDMRNRC